MNLTNVLVIGLGISGRSAAKFLLQQKSTVYAVDSRLKELKEIEAVQDLINNGLKCYSEDEFQDWHNIQTVVVSPGISPHHTLYKIAKEKELRIIGEIELGLAFFKGPLFGITGTNGKTTTTLLTAHILNTLGYRAKALGNIGTPITDHLLQGEESNTIGVIELSSFQLETLSLPVLDAAVILNITPDHLDRYSSMQEYAATKLKIQNCLKPDAFLYLEEDCAAQYLISACTDCVKAYGYSQKSFFYTDCKDLYKGAVNLGPLPLNLQRRRSHYLENFMASFALCQSLNISYPDFLSAFDSFQIPAHRIEFVKEIQGVRYFDDSKGTNIDAVKRAIETFQGPLILIVGGVDKGASYTPWLKDFEGKVKEVIAIGQAANKIREDLQLNYSVKCCSNLDSAVKLASVLAKPGESVLLSPGCSSYDMFRDYKHRGEEFKKIVHSL